MPPTHSSSRFRLVAVVVIVLAIATVFAVRTLSGGAKPGAEAEKPRVPVHVVAATTEPLVVRLDALGTVAPLQSVVVRSRVEGELTRVHFTEGQAVAAGELLAEIDARAHRVQLARVEGQQAQNLAQLAHAESELQRYRGLQGKQYISAQQIGSQESLVEQYRARRRIDQAQVDDARLQLDYTRIVAPIAGRVGLRRVDAGNLVRSGDADGLVTITQLAPISVQFSVAEAKVPVVIDAMRMQAGLEVEAWDREERRMLARGRLGTHDNLIDTTTGTLRFKAELANEDGALLPNQFVNVRLRVSDANALVIPEAAVQYGAAGSYVFVVDKDDAVDVRPVELGSADAERIAVLKGLVDGERVVVEGLDRLRAGTRVEVISVAKGGGTDA